MTTLALGLVGAAVGSFFGMPQLGFLIGSMIGSLIDPPKQQGPRLGDLKLQSATYGKMIPFFWGRGPLAGNIIHQTDLEEHKQKSSGKGGPVITSFTYTATWAVTIGAARVFGEDVIVDLLSIKANGRLIWSQTDGTDCPCTVYKGSETQLPDPTLEAIHGVGNVPAYRGQAYFVFTDYDLTDFGNVIPSLEFEVFTSAGDYPWQVSVGSPWNELNYGVSGFEYVNGEIIVTSQHAAAPQYAKWAKYDIYLNEIAAPVYTAGVDGMNNSAINNNNWIGTTPATTDVYWEVYDDTTGLSQQSTLISPDIYTHPPFANLSCVIDQAWFGTESVAGPVATIHKWTNGGGYVSSVGVGAFSATLLSLGPSDDGYLYVIKTAVGASEMWKYDVDLTLITYWNAAALASTRLTNGCGGNFVVYKDQVCFNYQSGTDHYIALVDIIGGAALVDSVQPLLTQATGGRLADLGGGLVMNCNNGVFSLNPPPAAVLLSKIVGDLCEMSPVVSYDVADLYDEVRWFVIGSQMIIRNAIQALRPIFFFDGVERGTSATFVRRDAFGESPARTIYAIPDDDLDARAYGEAPGPLLRTIRKKEQDLPRSVAMNFINVEAEYEVGTQSTPRQTTLSQQDVTIDAPVGLTNDEALQKCLATLLSEWMEREGFEFSTTRKWAKLQPCDLVYVRGRVIRIMTSTESPNGVIKWAGVLAAPSLYTSSVASLYYQIAPGAPNEGYIPQVPPGAKVATEMVLLDLPLVEDDDYSNGFYVAVGKATAGSWTGTSVQKSSDGGTTYAEVGSSTTADVIGSVALALGNFYGGNTFDESHIISVSLSDADAELTSVSELAVLNGANMCCIGTAGTGWEILQYKTATLVAAGVYELSGLLRGRRGTEWRMGTHTTNETFVALPTSININGSFAELGLSRKYKAVTFGTTLAAATAQDFANMGVALKPYSPVEVAGYRDGSGTIYLRCVRRTRIGGAWLDNVEVPLSEATESYKLNIYSDSSYGTLLNQYIYVLPEYPYGSAQSFSDFGSPSPSTLYFGWQQLGSYGYGYEGRGSV